MNMQTGSNFHSVDEEWLASFSAGSLSPSKQFLISCQAAMQPDLSSRLETMDAVGGAVLESAKGEAVATDFLDRVLDGIEAADDMPGVKPQNAGEMAVQKNDNWMPAPLQDYLARSGSAIKWRKLGFGVEKAILANDNGEDLYLLKARPGLKIPKHTHQGEEWALILQGGYHIGATGYTVGDLHRENEECLHSPVVDDDGESCITLVAIEGSLQFENPLMKLLKPVIGF